MSKNLLRVGSLEAKSGEKCFGINEFLVDGWPYHLSTWLINGTEDGPTLVVTAGVHGAEYASIAAALELGRSLEPEDLRGQIIVVPVMNLPAFRARSIYVCPLDGKNLNRVFPGQALGTASEQIADWVFGNVIRQAEYFVDLHGGDLIEALVPFTLFFRSGNDRVDQLSLEMAQVFGISYLVRSETPGSTLCAAAAAGAGIPSILAEAGGQGIWTSEHVALLTDGVRRLLRHLGLVGGGAPKPLPSTLLERFLWLRSEHEGFWYPGVSVGEEVRAGQELGRITDHEGRVLQRAVSPAHGRVLFIVSSLAINDADPLLAVGA